MKTETLKQLKEFTDGLVQKKRELVDEESQHERAVSLALNIAIAENLIDRAESTK